MTEPLRNLTMSDASARALVDLLPTLRERGLAQRDGNRNTERPQWFAWVTPAALTDPAALHDADMQAGSGHDGKIALFVRPEPVYEDYRRQIEQYPTTAEFTPKIIPSDALHRAAAERGHAIPFLAVTSTPEYRWRLEPLVDHDGLGNPMSYAADAERGDLTGRDKAREERFDYVAQNAPRVLVDIFTIPDAELPEPVLLRLGDGPVRDGDAVHMAQRRVTAFHHRGFRNSLNRAGGYRDLPGPDGTVARVRVPGSDLVTAALGIPHDAIQRTDFTDVAAAPFGWGSMQAHSKHTMLIPSTEGSHAERRQTGRWDKMVFTEFWPDKTTLVDLATRFAVGHDFTPEQERVFREGILARAPESQLPSLHRDWGKGMEFHRLVAAHLGVKNLRDRMVLARGQDQGQFRLDLLPTVKAATIWANSYRASIGRDPMSAPDVLDRVTRIAAASELTRPESTMSLAISTAARALGPLPKVERPPAVNVTLADALHNPYAGITYRPGRDGRGPEDAILFRERPASQRAEGRQSPSRTMHKAKGG